MNKIWVRWTAFIYSLSRVLAWVAGISILLIVIVLLREAFGRYLFNSPTTYAYSLSGLVSIIVLYFGLAYTAANDGHVASDMIYDHLPPRGQCVVQIVGHIIATAIGSLIVFYMSRQAGQSLRTNAVIQDLFDLPQASVQILIVAGSALFVLVSVTKALESIARFNRPETGGESSA